MPLLHLGMASLLARIMGREKKAMEKIRIEPNVASSIIILANEGRPRRFLDEKLKQVSDKGYDIGHRFKSHIGKPGYYSEQLAEFLGNLSSLGFIEELITIPDNVDIGADTIDAFSLRMRLRGYGSVNNFLLTDDCPNFLEDRILYSFSENPEDTLKFAKDCGLDTNPILQKHMSRYLETRDRNHRKFG